MKTPELLSDPVYHDEDAARVYLEVTRWPDFVSCPLCGSVEKISRLAGESMGRGWWFCGACKDKFTVRVGTVMERSHIPLHKWLLAFRLMASSKKGFSAHQLHRTLGVTYKSAWFLAHRIREAMKDHVGPKAPPLGGEGKVVEADELYYGERETKRVSQKRTTPYTKKGKGANKRVILGLVERGGKVRTFDIDAATTAEIAYVVRTNVSRDSNLQTDEAGVYTKLGTEFKGGHHTVIHSGKEYVRREVDRLVTTNTIENVFSVFKRGMRGVYQHCGESHLHRYLAEFDFRYNHREALGWTDEARTIEAVRGGVGKRLTYHQPNEA